MINVTIITHTPNVLRVQSTRIVIDVAESPRLMLNGWTDRHSTFHLPWRLRGSHVIILVSMGLRSKMGFCNLYPVIFNFGSPKQNRNYWR